MATVNILYTFNGTVPQGGLLADAGGNLFDATYSGGAYGLGSVFEIVKTTSGYASSPTTLVSFSGSNTYAVPWGKQAMRILYTDTHNVAEGAGAGAFAGALKERNRLAGKCVAVVQSGGNVDRAVFAQVLAEPDLE